MIKIGIDIHGVLDSFTEKYMRLIESFDPEKVEIHIISGIIEADGLIENPFIKQIPYKHWFSIHEECLIQGYVVSYDDKGRPWVDPEIWDKMKADYCESTGIDFMIDDSPVYGKHFNGSTVYLEQRNVNRDNWRHLKQTVDK